MKKYQCTLTSLYESKTIKTVIIEADTKSQAIWAASVGAGSIMCSCKAELYAPITLDKITTVEQLKERIVNGTLSLGNKYGKLMHLMSKEPAAGLEPVDVIYTNHGRHIVKRYI